MSTARGTAALMAAEAVFVLSGWAIHIGSKRILGLEAYGTLGILLGLLTHYRIFLATGVNRAVSRYIAEEPRRQGSIRRRAVLLQLGLGLGLGAAVWVVAPRLAEIWQSPGMTGYIRLTGFFLPVFGLYSVFRGTLNGLRLFEKEALVSILYSLLKVALLFALIGAFGIWGAVAGYLGAIVAATGLSRRVCPPEPPGPAFPLKPIVAFAVPVVSFSFLLSLLQSLDLYVVRALAPQAALSAGYYTCAQQGARIPYMLLYALGLALFPNVAARGGEEAETGRVVAKGMRWGLILALPLAAMISAAAPALMNWVYGADSAGAGAPLRILVFGQAFLALLYLAVVALAGAGHPWRATGLIAATLVLDGFLNLFLIPRYGIIGAAAATTAAGLAGLAAGLVALRGRFQAGLNLLGAGRVVGVSALIYGGIFFLRPDGWLLLPGLTAAAGVAGLLLRAVGEIDRNDGKMLMSVFSSRKT